MLFLQTGCAQAPQKPAPKPVELAFPPPPDEPRFYYERSLYGSTDVTQDQPGAALRRAVTGEVRTGEVLAKPYAVAVFKGRVFVSDSVLRHVHVFDVPNRRYFKIGDREGPGLLTKPLGLDVDASGTLYVADATPRQIMVYDRDGNFLRKLGGPQWFDRLSSVTVDTAGTKLYAVDIGGVKSDKHKVRVFDAISGAHLMDIGKRGMGPGDFNLPRDLAIGKDGRLYVVDGGNFRVVIFDREGNYLKSFGDVGRRPGQFARPKEIAIDRDGNVYVVDTAFGNIQIFNADGELLMFIGDRAEIDAPARYKLPSGVALDEDGRILIVDQWFRKVDIFRPARLATGQGFLGAVGKR